MTQCVAASRQRGAPSSSRSSCRFAVEKCRLLRPDRSARVFSGAMKSTAVPSLLFFVAVVLSLLFVSSSYAASSLLPDAVSDNNNVDDVASHSKGRLTRVYRRHVISFITPKQQNSQAAECNFFSTHVISRCVY